MVLPGLLGQFQQHPTGTPSPTATVYLLRWRITHPNLPNWRFSNANI